eukprot:4685478-Prymnesium_polylepis.2
MDRARDMQPVHSERGASTRSESDSADAARGIECEPLTSSEALRPVPCVCESWITSACRGLCSTSSPSTLAAAVCTRLFVTLCRTASLAALFPAR